METPSGQLDSLRADLARLLDSCNRAPAADKATDLPALTPAIEQLLDVMTRFEADAGSAPNPDASITEIGEYALQLVVRLGDTVDDLALQDQQKSLTHLVMEDAFELLTDKLPEDAARFFSEGMQQMDALDYPTHIREVMGKYHRLWTVKRSLH